MSDHGGQKLYKQGPVEITGGGSFPAPPQSTRILLIGVCLITNFNALPRFYLDWELL